MRWLADSTDTMPWLESSDLAKLGKRVVYPKRHQRPAERPNKERLMPLVKSEVWCDTRFAAIILNNFHSLHRIVRHVEEIEVWGGDISFGQHRFSEPFN